MFYAILDKTVTMPNGNITNSIGPFPTIEGMMGWVAEHDDWLEAQGVGVVDGEYLAEPF